MTDLSRRRFLQVTAAGGAGVLLSTAAGARPARATGTDLRVYVLVTDGMRPDEVTALTTPTLWSLQQAGTTFPNARSLPVMETIPNHVMMMSGVRPDRSGVPANAVFDRAEGAVRTLDRQTDLKAPTLLERLAATGRTTGSVLSKEYLYGIFGTRATHRWEPFPLVPVTEHAPDAATMDAAIAMVDEFDPHLVFVNLGDVDRVGHSDVTGPLGLAAARRASLTTQDLQVARFTTHLQTTGRWASSVLVVLADHSMDFSVPTNVISVDLVLQARPDLRSQVQIGQNGGADLLYWTGAARDRSRGLQEVASLVRAHPGVLSVQPPAQLRLGPEAGDLVAYCRPGWRFSDPTVVSNPIPGNHGHPATEPIPFFVAGGHPRVRQGVSTAQARTVDVAPTVGSLFGLSAPRGGYDGTARREAFRR
ncbi:alkaline phosphatase family protein [Klenkia brasiliensis]|uniref:Predicted pyrophosphatase or phosphodiesterase, AlkP superfamily n=1 Tax=Klenkia brasiliensis TaxID=333142 RepID=A0A1G7SQ80_9ACTN|nr:alkaline phosphatase family protein [Klenkia brasiliensis]SDG25128.1 Predicted pyrophosphatase or phosphodiesterase, AlkP superfamily [Klenkia brasiliensis]